MASTIMAMPMLRLQSTYDTIMVPFICVMFVNRAEISAPTPAATIVAAIGTI